MGMEQNIPNEPTSKRKTRKTATVEVEGVVVGRDKKVIPPNDVFKLAALGCKDIEIGEWFGIDGNTLRYNFSVELTKGRQSLKQSLRRAMLHNACVNHNAALQIFLAKNFLGMSDNPVDSEANAPLPWTDDDE
jgi:hypothetical protein